MTACGRWQVFASLAGWCRCAAGCKPGTVDEADDPPDPNDAPGEDTEDDDWVDLCDQCGTQVDDNQILALVDDSSAVHAVNPDFDGRRMVTACSPECLRILQAQYAARPWLEVEQWQGKVWRAMEDYGGHATPEQLVEATGLNPAQVDLGVLYHNLQFLQYKLGEAEPE
jgi:hypothetical protein